MSTILLVSGHPAFASYDCLLVLLCRLGLDVSQKNLCPPSKMAVCLGVEIDTVKCTISVPEDKLQRIRHMVDAWGNRHFCSIRQLQILLGHLMYIQKCVKPSCYFVNRILELLRNNYDAQAVFLIAYFGFLRISNLAAHAHKDFDPSRHLTPFQNISCPCLLNGQRLINFEIRSKQVLLQGYGIASWVQ